MLQMSLTWHHLKSSRPGVRSYNRIIIDTSAHNRSECAYARVWCYMHFVWCKFVRKGLNRSFRVIDRSSRSKRKVWVKFQNAEIYFTIGGIEKKETGSHWSLTTAQYSASSWFSRSSSVCPNLKGHHSWGLHELPCILKSSSWLQFRSLTF